MNSPSSGSHVTAPPRATPRAHPPGEDSTAATPLSRALLLLALAVSSLLVLLTPTDNVDIWSHLKTGQWILENRQLPRHDLYTFTIPPDRVWVDVHWLYQILVALLYQAGGWIAIGAGRLVVAALWAAMLWRYLSVYRPADFLPRALALLLAVAAARYRMVDRPEILGFVLLAALLACWARGEREGRIHWLPTLLLQWVWGLSHTSCILGVLGALVVSIAHFFQWVDRAHPSSPFYASPAARTTDFSPAQIAPRLPLLQLLAYPIAMACVSMLNPAGWVMLTYSITEGAKTYIDEFKSPGPAFYLGPVTPLLLLALWGTLRLARAEGWTWRFFIRQRVGILLGISVPFLVQTTRMSRFLPLAATAALPLVVEGLRGLHEFAAPAPSTSATAASRWLRRSGAALTLALVFITIAMDPFLDPRPLRLGVDERKYPAAAATFIETHSLHGRIFSHTNDGAYLLWRLAPRSRIYGFNESRLNADVLVEFVQLRTPEQLAGLLAHYQVDCAIVPLTVDPKRKETDFANALLANPAWTPVFWDDRFMLFLPMQGRHAEFARAQRTFLHPDWLPYPRSDRVNTPLFLESVKKIGPARALDELQRLRELSPENFRASMALAILNEALRGDPKLTESALRRAEQLHPRHPETLSLLGRWHLKNGDPAAGIDYLERAITHSDSKADARYNFAVALQRLGRIDQARTQLNLVLAEQPDHPQATRLLQRLDSPSGS